ncbi:MAG: toxin-antitoxin system YwqK family antitoxin [Bacteroidales bacterium]|jgi:antitoxin component YwqK of YwqJK toxin-antitoxin module|nr:toxin-antitoxin system YwqK family antitoxin [Bacteroidales bacterium]
MHRLFLLFLVLVFPFSSFSQETMNQTDGNGKKQGLWKKCDSLGHLVYEGFFKNNIPVDTFRYYYPSGQIKTISVFSNEGRRATITSFFPNGQHMACGHYLEEKKDSLWRFFSETDGSMVSEEFYVDGKKDGVSKIFYPDGVQAEVSTWKNGIMDGLSEQYYSDGKIKLRLSYMDGEKNDACSTWFMSGKLMITGKYYQGHPDGHWIFYNEQGEIIKTEDYQKGELLQTSEPAK